LQLFFLECHLFEQEILKTNNNNQSIELEEASKTQDRGKDIEHCSDDFEDVDGPPEGRTQQNSIPTAPAVSSDTNLQFQTLPLSTWLKFAGRGDVWKKILLQILQNPVLWAIAVGFILSLSTVGPRFLNASSTDFIPGLAWISITLSWLGQCVSPVALFSMGIWMQKEWRSLFTIPVWSAVLFMIAKLIVVPLVRPVTDGRSASFVSECPYVCVSACEFSDHRVLITASHYVYLHMIFKGHGWSCNGDAS
jgi:predicted permease